MIYYCVKSLRGDFVGATPEAVTQSFSDMLGNAPTMMLWMVIICLIGFAVCFMGLQNGIEKISKVMMSALLIIMVILAVHSVMMEGAGEGIRFYLIPDFQKIKEAGVGNVVFAALSQSFFTLSIGIGAMLIFGSYLDKSRSLTGEAVSITRTRYFCCADSRIYHYSGMLLLWNPARCRSKPYLYHSAQYFCKDERRGFVGKSVLPVSDICCGFNDHCCI